MKWYDYIKVFLKNRKATVGISILMLFTVIAIFAPFMAPYSPTDMSFPPLKGISWKHPLGTTLSGQDIFSQVIWGTRYSLFVGVVTGLITTIISVAIGFTAGYFSGIIAEILTMLINIFLVIPGLPLIIVISAYIPVKNIWTIILTISLTGWAWGARVLRSQVLTLKNRDFVKASLIVGESSFHIIFKDIFPNMLGLVAASFFGNAIYAVLAEASLEFLGLGDTSIISWGTILYWAQNNQAILLGSWQWFTIPGLFIALLGMAFALLNFAVDEIANPRLRGR